MIGTFEVSKLPRQLGKTTILKNILDNVIAGAKVILGEQEKTYDEVYVIYTHEQTKIYFNYSFGSYPQIEILSAYHLINQRGHIDRGKVLCLIDDCFNMDIIIQNDLIRTLEQLSNTVDIFAIGTTPKNKIKQFTDYL